jgi:hypothetical protein
MRLLTVLCVAALVVAFAVPASAETQNIKVSGDIKAAYVYQRDIGFRTKDTASETLDSAKRYNENFFMQQIGLNVEADLTDNVSTYIRLINERDWNANYDSTSPGNSFDILLDEAYVTLKEMLYAPLTVKIGRQNIWLGKGFVIGNSGNWGAGGLPATINEYSDMTAFDAIRATLDYDPWTVDLIYSKIGDSTFGTTSNRDDIDLYVANVGYDFTKYDAEAEAYYIMEHDKTVKHVAETLSDSPGKPSVIHTVGLRGSLVPFESMNLWAEGALQVGRERSTAGLDNKREAYALDLGMDYTFTDVKWTPKVGAEWIYLSGDKSDGKTKAWDPVYRGKFDNYIADFRGIAGKGQSTDTGMSNQQSIALFGAISPMTDITLDGKWTYLWLDQKLTTATAAQNVDSKKVGWEFDGKVAYDYTEDVQFSTTVGYFKPGKLYNAAYNKAATQVVAGVTVDF